MLSIFNFIPFREHVLFMPFAKYRIFEKAEKTERIDADMDCLLSLFFFLELFYNAWPEELLNF